MIISKTTLITITILTANTCFLLGAYYQHHIVQRNIRLLIETDPYAYYIRHKLYNLLTYFGTNPNFENSRIHKIMKYGFPGLADLHFYKNFMLSYDRRNRVAHWVCEHLQAECIKPTTALNRRRAQYAPDMNVPSSFRADNADYTGSGYDRGHLAAAGNHKCSQTHCNETFYMTNIAPQIGKGFNHDAWNKLELYVRNLTERYGSVYVYTGPLYLPKKHDAKKFVVDYEVIGRNTVAVPTHFFKVIVIESKLNADKPYMEAYVLPNEPIDKGINLRDFICNIRTIERYAGLKFFENMRCSYFFGVNYSQASRIFRNFT